jgi:solute carrier family 25 citrate transporter 1
MYSSTLNCFYQIIQKEGIIALYAGVIPRLGRVVPGQGIIFMSFESIESALHSNFAVFQ